MPEPVKNGAEREVACAYEKSDAYAPGVVTALVGLALFGIFLGIMLNFGFDRLKNRYASRPLRLERILPPRPRLQIDEAGDLKRYLGEQNRWLETYGKTPTGRRIPIARAMEILSHE